MATTRLSVKRVVTGGFVAGVILNASDFITNKYVMAGEMAAMSARLGLDASLMQKPAVMATWIAIDFVFGTLIVLAYALMRPRLGPGPKTALAAGTILWASSNLLMIGFAAIGIFTMTMAIESAVFGWVSVAIASTVGAAVYREN